MQKLRKRKWPQCLSNKIHFILKDGNLIRKKDAETLSGWFALSYFILKVKAWSKSESDLKKKCPRVGLPSEKRRAKHSICHFHLEHSYLKALTPPAGDIYLCTSNVFGQLTRKSFQNTLINCHWVLNVKLQLIRKNVNCFPHWLTGWLIELSQNLDSFWSVAGFKWRSS